MTRHLRPSTLRRLRGEPLESRLLLANDLPFQNAAQPFNVNNDLQVTALDALQIINFMNRFDDTMTLPDQNLGDNFPDVNGSGGVTGHDAHLVVNRLGPNGPSLLAGKLIHDSAPGESTNVDFITNNFEMKFGTTNVAEPQQLLIRWNQQGPFVAAGTVSDDNPLCLSEAELSILAGGAIGQGEHTIEAMLDNQSSSIEFTVTIDQQAPLIAALHLDPLDDSRFSHQDGITNPGVPALQGLAEPGTLVVIAVDGISVGSFLNESPLFQFQLDPHGDGDYVASATATDVAGNTTRATDLSFTIDTTPPLVPLFDVTALKPTNLGPGIKAVSLQGTTSPDSEVRLHVNDVTYLTTADDLGEF